MPGYGAWRGVGGPSCPSETLDRGHTSPGTESEAFRAGSEKSDDCEDEGALLAERQVEEKGVAGLPPDVGIGPAHHLGLRSNRRHLTAPAGPPPHAPGELTLVRSRHGDPTERVP